MNTERPPRPMRRVVYTALLALILETALCGIAHAEPIEKPTAQSRGPVLLAQAKAEKAAAPRISRSAYAALVADMIVQRKRRRVPASVYGKVTVDFTLDRNGAVSRLRVARSSGHATLDAEALEMVTWAEPFPKPPADLKDLDFTMPVTFAPQPRKWPG